MKADNDLVDLREVASSLRRGWRWIAFGAIGGLVLAGVITLLLRPKYEGTATVLLRSGAEGAAPALGGSSRGGQGGSFSLGGLADMLSIASGFDTEIEILTSRSVIASVVDSLGLQARVRNPRGVAPFSLFSSARFDPELRSGIYRFEREGAAYSVRGPGVSARAVPGEPLALNRSAVTLRADVQLPDEFEVELVDRQDAVAAIRERLEGERAGGDVAELVYRGPDPYTAAAVPNAMIAKYLARRKTTDRGVNQHRYEFLTAHADSLRTELARAEATLRRTQEESGVLDPEIFGKAELEQGLELRGALEMAEVEIRAFQEVLAQASTGTLSPRSLAAYPTFLRNEAINDLLSSLLELETQRTALLERRTERDPDVVVLDRQIRQLEDQLVSMSSSYLEGLQRQQTEIRRELGRYGAALAALPAQAEANYRSQREVRRLSETLGVLQAQLVQARLAAIAEGGDVRPVDPAVPPKEPVFPKPLLNLAIGLLGGLFLGVFGALGSRYLGDRLRDPQDAELAAGVPAVALSSNVPLLLSAGDATRSVLVVCIGAGPAASAVARRIASTAALQGRSVVLADLEHVPTALPIPSASDRTDIVPRGETYAALADHLHPADRADAGGYLVYRANGNGSSGVDARAVVEELERRFSLVVAALPSLGRFPTPALLAAERPVILAARAGSATRTELRDAVAALDHLGISVLGVVLRNGADGDRGAAD